MHTVTLIFPSLICFLDHRSDSDSEPLAIVFGQGACPKKQISEGKLLIYFSEASIAHNQKLSP